MIIDTHCHFDMMPNPEAYIESKELAGDIIIGMTNLPSHFMMGLPHLKSYKHVRLALGMHPLLAAENMNELTLFRQLLDQTSYIGEIGLDFSNEGNNSKIEQVFLLREILSSLKGKKKVISVHSRKAEKILLGLLCEHNIQNVIFHWYSGSLELIPSIIERGYYFSINESMCSSQNGRSIISMIPHDRVLTETDLPFNPKADIKKVLTFMNMTETDVYSNFMTLINRIKDN